MRILVTAFDPFGGDTVNPAREAASRLPERIGAAGITVRTVPTVFHKSISVLSAALEELRPGAVLCVGQAGGRHAITPERVAVNLDDARIPDNAGNRPVDTPIVPDGPPAYFATLPVKAMVRAIRQAGLPAALSNTAGTFVCNHLMYGALHLARAYPGMRAGFVHVPFLPEQAAVRTEAVPSMSLDDIARGLEACIRAVAEHGTDIAASEGCEH